MRITRTSHLRFAFFLALVFVAFGLQGQSFYRYYDPQTSFFRDAVETADGGFVMVGGTESNNKLFIQRTDANGIDQWTKVQDLNGARGVAVCRAGDGGFGVLCDRYDDSGTQRCILLKIDSAGTTEWERVLVSPTLANGFVDIAAMPDGGFAVLGSGRVLAPAPDFHLRLLRLDPAGNELWSQNLGSTTEGKEIPTGLAVLANGDIVVAGERREAATVQDGSDFFLAKTDAAGSILWQQEYNKPGYQTTYDFKVAPNGDLVVLGETKQTDPVTMTLLRTDAQGAEIWYRHTFDLFNSLDPAAVIRAISCLALDLAGNAYVPIFTTDFSSSQFTVSALRLSENGDSTWVKEWPSSDVFESAMLTTDQHFAFVGYSDAIFGLGKATLWKTDWTGSGSYLSTLSGRIFWDDDDDCVLGGNEPALPVFVVEAKHESGKSYHRVTGADGQYTFFVPLVGEYSIRARPRTGLSTLWQACDTPSTYIFTPGSVAPVPPLGVKSLVDCPYLEIEIASTRLRRCTTATYFVQYCNLGTQTATAASAQIVLDPLLTFVNSCIPLSGTSGDTLLFDLGDVVPGQCSSFWLRADVDCDAQVGQALCAYARIFPDSSCLPPDPLWDGSNVEVQAGCNGSATFTIRNTGTGDMSGPVSYVIIEDQIMYGSGNVQLESGKDTVINVTAPLGESYYIRVEQRPGHPGEGSRTATFADDCAGQSGSSLALQLPLGTGGPYEDIDCSPVVTSFDPNDKQGFPMGWHTEHYLEVGQEIEYKIRFQNTGNDTAFLVVVRDTLPEALDPATVRPGAASHPYTFQISESNALVFTFANILLPDSTTNEPASNGFVTFRVAQRPDLPLGTVIENRAAIYFDFNDPVITEPYFHTIGRPLLIVATGEPVPGTLGLDVFPNPLYEYADFRLDVEASGEFRFQLFDLAGKTLREQFFSGNTYRLHRNDLPPGIYFFRFENAAGKAVAGKIAIGK